MKKEILKAEEKKKKFEMLENILRISEEKGRNSKKYGILYYCLVKLTTEATEKELLRLEMN